LTSIAFDVIINDNNNQFQKKQAYVCKKTAGKPIAACRLLKRATLGRYYHQE